MKNARFALVLSAAVICLLASIPSASAQSGDQISGCDQGTGCDHQMNTNQCSRGAAFWVIPPEELTYTVDQWYLSWSPCTIRVRILLLDSNDRPYYTAWKKRSNTSGGSQTDVLFEWDARKWCYSQYQVLRKDGTWLNDWHWSDAYMNSQTRRELCTDQ